MDIGTAQDINITKVLLKMMGFFIHPVFQSVLDCLPGTNDDVIVNPVPVFIPGRSLQTIPPWP